MIVEGFDQRKRTLHNVTSFVIIGRNLFSATDRKQIQIDLI